MEDGAIVSVAGGLGVVQLNNAQGSRGTLNIGTGGLAGTLDAGIVTAGSFGASAIVNFNHTDSITFGASLRGGTIADLSVTKLASGTTVLTGSNSYSGGTRINGGVLSVGSDVNLGANSGALSFDGGALRTTAGFTMNRGTTLHAGGGTFDIEAGGLVQQGVISGTGALIKTGAGALTLSGGNTYSGGTLLNSGTLVLGNNNALGTGTLTIGNGTTLGRTGARYIANGLLINGDFTSQGHGSGDVLAVTGPVDLGDGIRRISTENGGQIRFLGDVSGSGGITVAGDGDPVFLFGAKTYTGLTTVENGGILVVQSFGNAINGDLVVEAGGVFSLLSNEAIADTSCVTVSGTMSLVNLSGPLVETIGNLNGDGTIIVNVDRPYGWSSLLVGSGSFGGKIRNDTPFDGRLNFTKTTSGTLTLSGSNSYEGTTTVQAGRLEINGVNSGTGAVTVQNGATLAGSGTVAGAVTVENGGILAPGESPGTLNVGALTLHGASVSEFELGATSDLINVAGDFTLDGILNLVDSGGFANTTYTLFTYGGNLTNHFFDLNLVPTGWNRANFVIDLTTEGEVKLVVDNSVTIQYWTGTNTQPTGEPATGGDGAWDNSETNWTNVNGSLNTQWQGVVGVFGGTGGSVVVADAVTFQQLQFTVDGYVLDSDGGSLGITGSSSEIWTAAGVGTEILTEITGTGALVKSGLGTLSLTGSNSYQGGTQHNTGTLLVGDDHALGIGALQLGGGSTFGVVSGAGVFLANDVAVNGE